MLRALTALLAFAHAADLPSAYPPTITSDGKGEDGQAEAYSQSKAKQITFMQPTFLRAVIPGKCNLVIGSRGVFVQEIPCRPLRCWQGLTADANLAPHLLTTCPIECRCTSGARSLPATILNLGMRLCRQFSISIPSDNHLRWRRRGGARRSSQREQIGQTGLLAAGPAGVPEPE